MDSEMEVCFSLADTQIISLSFAIPPFYHPFLTDSKDYTMEHFKSKWDFLTDTAHTHTLNSLDDDVIQS